MLELKDCIVLQNSYLRLRYSVRKNSSVRHLDVFKISVFFERESGIVPMFKENISWILIIGEPFILKELVIITCNWQYLVL